MVCRIAIIKIMHPKYERNIAVNMKHEHEVSRNTSSKVIHNINKHQPHLLQPNYNSPT